MQSKPLVLMRRNWTVALTRAHWVVRRNLLQLYPILDMRGWSNWPRWERVVRSFWKRKTDEELPKWTAFCARNSWKSKWDLKTITVWRCLPANTIETSKSLPNHTMHNRCPTWFKMCRMYKFQYWARTHKARFSENSKRYNKNLDKASTPT